VSTAGPLEHVHEHPEISAEDLVLIHRFKPKGARVLDVGSGRGGFVEIARAQGFDAMALDVEPSAAVIWSRDGIPGVLGDGSRTPFVDACFDVLRMKELIEHLPNPLLVVREAKRVLKSQGLLIAHVPTQYSQLFPIGNFWDDYTHVRPFSALGLRRLVEDAGLELVDVKGYVAGRNRLERVVGSAIARVLPHTYRLLARKP
jgi:SAM-dependent methyltransferase